MGTLRLIEKFIITKQVDMLYVLNFYSVQRNQKQFHRFLINDKDSVKYIIALHF
jgi:hypothetical protein